MYLKCKLGFCTTPVSRNSGYGQDFKLKISFNLSNTIYLNAIPLFLGHIAPTFYRSLLYARLFFTLSIGKQKEYRKPDCCRPCGDAGLEATEHFLWHIFMGRHSILGKPTILCLEPLLSVDLERSQMAVKIHMINRYNLLFAFNNELSFHLIFKSLSCLIVRMEQLSHIVVCNVSFSLT